MYRVSITAPSRLHFGLWSLAGGDRRQFGGIGVMIDQPGLRVVISAAPALSATGPLAERALEFARRWAAFHQLPALQCAIEVISAPPDHVGLGTGTQLALAVAAGLCETHGLEIESPQALAASVDRGLRSAVGTYGFLHGGLIAEQGKLPDETISPLDCRIDLPTEWRFVLARPLGMAGLAGEDEAAAISGLPEVPPAVTDELVALAYDQLLPTAVTGDFPAFAESTYRYGRLAGEIFKARQGGPYNGPLLTALVERIRELGFDGAGQSSWGPTVFAACPSQADAERLSGALQAGLPAGTLETMIASPCRNGAQIERLALGEQAAAR
jgi:beta-ribofuranosylaminobenzene 5'-phosphate synthase